MKFFRTLFAVFFANVVLIALVVGAVFLGGVVSKARKQHVDKGSYLVLDIYGDVPMYDPPQTLPSTLMGNEPETLHRILDNLDKAAVDDRIAGVVVKISGNNGLGYAMIEEMRDAIDRVQEAGKPVIAYGEIMGRKELFLASTCDSVFIAPAGEVEITGMGAVEPFVKGTLDKLGIEPNIHRIKEYKSAAEPIIRTDMSPENKEMTGWMLGEMWDVQMAAISHDRAISVADLIGDMDYALFQPDEAVEAGLVDGQYFWNDLEDHLKGDEDEFKSISESAYAKVKRKDVGLDGDKKIAIVHAQGFIGGRESRVDPMLGVMMGHETVVADLRAAADDDDVVAVIFRVDSGGGDSFTSDVIGREVQRVAARKPVIVSMVNVAASGGYSISYRATKLVADSLSVTGSIGSITGKFNVAGMYNKLGVTFDWVTKGPNALFNSSVQNYTDKQYERVVENHWAGVNRWMQDIADHRGMTFERLESLAHGRVWTGRQAKANGLIDDIGGLHRAIEIAKDAAGIAPAERVTLESFPKKKGLLQLITGGDAGSATVAWAAWHFVRHDLAETLNLLSSGRLAVWSGRIVD